MTFDLASLLVLGIFIETVVQAIKPAWNSETKHFAYAEIVSMAVGILVGIVGQVNLLAGLINPDNVVALYLLYAVSGLTLGRGSSFIFDLWEKVRTFDKDKAGQAADIAEKIAEIVKKLFGIEIDEEPIVETDNEADDPEETE